MQRYKMTTKQHKQLLKASQPTMMIALQCGEPPSPRDNAMAVWMSWGKEMGFDYTTVRPVSGQPETVFEAVSNG